MLIHREKRLIAFVFKTALLILVGVVLFMPKIDLAFGPLVATVEADEPPTS